jgi:hypothetical protein
MDEGAIVTGPLLMEKANFLSKELGYNDFVFTNG